MTAPLNDDDVADRSEMLFRIMAETLDTQPVEVVANVLIGLVSAMALGNTQTRAAALEVAAGFHKDIVAAIDGQYPPGAVTP